jgi:hypothetical protein
MVFEPLERPGGWAVACTLLLPHRDRIFMCPSVQADRAAVYKRRSPVSHGCEGWEVPGRGSR